jgi:transglutaminase-like putative cysteine protease
MNSPQPSAKEPFHLLALRAIVYAGAALLFALPLAGWAGVVAAVAAVSVGLLLARSLAASRIRLSAVALGALAVALLGLYSPSLLGRPAWVARVLGVPTTLALIDVFLFGLTTLGAAVGLRFLATRVPALGLLEAAAMAGAVVWLFAGHRDLELGRPRFVADWSLSRGHDPLVVLLGIGVITAGALALVFLQRQRVAKTLATLLALLLLFAGAYWLLTQWGPNIRTQMAHAGGGSKGKDGKGGPREPEQSFEPQQENPKGKPVLLVLLHDDFTPVEGGFYLRQIASSQFNGKRLVRATLAGADDDVPHKLPTKLEEIAATKGLPGKLIPTTVYFFEDHAQLPALVKAVAVGPKQNPNPKMFVAAYDVKSLVQDVPYLGLAGAAAGNPAWGEALRRHYLAYPNDPRYRELAEQILASLPPAQRGVALRRAVATLRWVEKNIIYTKKPSAGNDPDPTTAFLFGDRRGYCVHIAHAMAYLLRAQGIPTRVASGYHAPASRRGAGSSILVQSTDGHAWCEMYLEGHGWVVIDPSPERSESPPPPEPSSELQRQMGEMARREQAKKRDDSRKKADEASSDLLWLWLLLAATGLLATLYGVKVWRRLAPRFAPAGQLYRVCYRAVLDRLAELGLSRQFGETREEFASRMERLAPEFVELSAAHVRKAVAGEESHAVGEWRQRAARVVRSIAARFPVHRRVLGVLNPVSWLWAR